MYTPTQMEAIKIFWKKELTDGCIITGLCLDKYWELKDRRLCIKTYAGYYLVQSKKWNFHDNCWIVWKPSSIEILWHIPTLEDVFRYIEEKNLVLNITKRDWEELYSIHIYGRQWVHNWFFCYINPTIPVIEQPEETLKELISLFK